MAQNAQNRFQLFVENFLVYGLGGILLKAVPFIMTPIITRFIPDPADYGAVDLYNTITSFGTALAALGMYDSAFRFFFEKETDAYRKSVTSTAAGISITAACVILIGFVVARDVLSKLFFGTGQYSHLIVLAGIYIISYVVSSSLIWPIRFENKRRVYLLSQLVSSIATYALTIFLLYSFQLTVTAIPLSNIFVTVLLALCYLVYNKKWYRVKFFDRTLAKQLLKFGVPLVPTFLTYWVFNSIDRIMITHQIGTAANGIYAIGAKIALVSQLIYTAFASGWQYFSFSTMKDDDQVEMTSNIFQWLAAISFFCFALSIFFYKWVFRLLFTGSYVEGYMVFPYLFLAPLMLMLFQVAANQLLVVKKSYIVTLCLAAGAVTNIILNWVFIQLFGIVGCALATLLGYLLSVLIVLAVTSRRKLMRVSRRFVVCLVAAFFLALYIFFVDRYSAVVAAAVSATILLLYLSDIKRLKGLVKR